MVGFQLSSVTAAPLAVGLLVVFVATARTGRAGPAREEAGEPQPGPETEGPEVAAIQRTGQALIALARTPQGRSAIGTTARLVKAGRAALRPPPPSDADPAPRLRDEPNG